MAGWLYEYKLLEWIGWLLVVVVDAYSHSGSDSHSTHIPQTTHYTHGQKSRCFASRIHKLDQCMCNSLQYTSAMFVAIWKVADIELKTKMEN